MPSAPGSCYTEGRTVHCVSMKCVITVMGAVSGRGGSGRQTSWWSDREVASGLCEELIQSCGARGLLPVGGSACACGWNNSCAEWRETCAVGQGLTEGPAQGKGGWAPDGRREPSSPTGFRNEGREVKRVRRAKLTGRSRSLNLLLKGGERSAGLRRRCSQKG